MPISSTREDSAEVMDQAGALAQRRDESRKGFSNGPIAEWQSNRFGTRRDISLHSRDLPPVSTHHPSRENPEAESIPPYVKRSVCSALVRASGTPSPALDGLSLFHAPSSLESSRENPEADEALTVARARSGSFASQEEPWEGAQPPTQPR